MRRACGTCYMTIRPGEYEPDGGSYGTCDSCGDHAIVHRIRKAELPDAYDCICGWSRTRLYGETIADAKRAHEGSDIHRIALADRAAHS